MQHARDSTVYQLAPADRLNVTISSFNERSEFSQRVLTPIISQAHFQSPYLSITISARRCLSWLLIVACDEITVLVCWCTGASNELRVAHSFRNRHIPTDEPYIANDVYFPSQAGNGYGSSWHNNEVVTAPIASGCTCFSR